jgi:methyl-accepting chemotaxis protein
MTPENGRMITSTRIFRRRTGVAIVSTLLLAGCSSASSTFSSTGSPVGGQGSASGGQVSAAVQAAKDKLCTTLGDLSGSLDTVAQNGIAEGDEIVTTLTTLATALDTAASGLQLVGATDEATSASSLASDVTKLANHGGEEAKTAAANASTKLDDLSNQAACP